MPAPYFSGKLVSDTWFLWAKGIACVAVKRKEMFIIYLDYEPATDIWNNKVIIPVYNRLLCTSTSCNTAVLIWLAAILLSIRRWPQPTDPIMLILFLFVHISLVASLTKWGEVCRIFLKKVSEKRTLQCDMDECTLSIRGEEYKSAQCNLDREYFIWILEK